VRVGVVDIGTNSTRLLIADVEPDGRAAEIDRRTAVTRLGQGVDASGALDDAAMERVFATLEAYRTALDEAGAEATVAVLTSAVRDARNGARFAEEVHERFGLDARVVSGDEEAQLTFLGATSDKAGTPEAEICVIDIGGGSTEFVVGARGAVDFHVSTQAGVVRQTERHLHSDPPAPEEVQALAAEVHEIFEREVPEHVRARVALGVAVAGTATSCAAMAQELEPYDPVKVHGYRLAMGTCELLLARLAAMTEERRRHVPGLHPDRAPTIVAGVVMLIEAMRTLGLEEVEVSEHDILRGAALRRAGAG
jgi:exopolyphosphatase/guanosine-5'-triphosphate,3'-diphosphate pyrophosphatase